MLLLGHAAAELPRVWCADGLDSERGAKRMLPIISEERSARPSTEAYVPRHEDSLLLYLLG